MEKKSTDPPAKRKIHDSLDSASSAYDGGLITNSSKRPKAPSSRESIVPPRHPGSSYSADKNGGRHLHTHKTRDPDGFVASGNQTSYSTPNERRETTQVPGRVASDPPSFRAQHKTSTPPAVSDPSPAKTRSSRRSSDRKESEGSNVEFISTLVSLPELSQKARLTALSVQELSELEVALEITEEDGWREDWSGNLAFTDKEVLNPKKTRNGVGTAGTFRQPLYIWAQNDNPVALRIWHNLFRYVYHLKDTPAMAKTILANADAKDSVAMEQGFRRVSYDPKVLQQDGWTTAKASEPVGATGGAYRIGDHVRWQGSDGIVIAYIHDQDLGDLWRGIWLDEALECFDMEAEELHDARKKWERRAKAASGPSSKGQKKDKENQSRRSHRYSAASDFQVNGVEHGIVLAASFARGARPGVYWPARVMHASEAVTSQGGKSRRGAPRQRLDLVFLAPYWNSPSNAGVTVPSANSRQRVESFAESLSRHGESLFSTGPLFDVESVDVSDEMIEEYPYDGKDGGINIDQLRVAFRFTGLPKAAFPRFLDSHRLALALKTFAQERLPPRTSDQASAGLFETHPMSVLAPMFPPEVLHLPYPFILSQLPPPPIEQSVNNGEQRHLEPILRINTIVSAMKPPSCWGKGMLTTDTSPESPSTRIITRVAESPYIDTGALLRQSNQGEGQSVDLDQFIRDLLALKDAVTGKQSPALEAMFQNLQQLLSLASPGFADVSTEERKLKSRAIVKTWVFAKVCLLVAVSKSWEKI